MIEELTTQTEDMTTEEMGQFIADFSSKALAILNERLQQRTSVACAPLDEELTALAVESADIEAQAQGVIERMASAERVKRFEYDQFVMQGKTAEAEAKLAELEEVKAAPAKIDQRRREIAERCEQIEAEKGTALRRAAEDFKEASITLIRGAETGLAAILDETRGNLNQLETRTGTSLYHPENLTAPEKSTEWRTLNRLYSGRVR
jgi:hypothetical protein